MIPENKDIDAETLKVMVMNVNRTQVLPKEFLSDSVYFFDRDTQEISIVA